MTSATPLSPAATGRSPLPHSSPLPTSHPVPSSHSGFTVGSSGSRSGQAHAKPISWSRPPFSTAQAPAAPTGSATVATSVVTVVGSMARMHLGNRDVPESGNSSNSSARNLGLDAVHNAETGLSTPPEDENKAIVEQVIPTIIVMPSYTSTPTSTNTSTRMNRSTHATAPLGPSVPMRRGVVVGGRKQMRRKRGAMIPSATTMAAATAAAQQAIAAATTTTKAAEKVPSPPPSPKQQPIHVTQPSQAPPPPPQPQTEPIQAEAPEETNTVATQSLVPREYNLIDEALVPYGHLPPRTAAQKQVVRRLLIRPANDQESHHIETERCARPPLTSCTQRALVGGMYCHFHSCKGTNQDLLDCRGLVFKPEETRFCETGFHNEKGERMSNFVFGYMINGLHQSNEAEAARNRDRDRTLAWFEEKFGQALDAPLPPAIDLTSATTQFKELQLQTSNPPWTPSAKTSPVSTAFSSPRTHHQYITFNRPPAGWGSSLVDKWWEGNWSHQVSVPLELQHQADTYSYYHHSRSNPSSPPSEGHDTVYGFSRPTSPTLARPKSPSAKARDPMKESLITEYGDRLSVSARWQPTFRPQLRPPKLKRHLTA